MVLTLLDDVSDHIQPSFTVWRELEFLIRQSYNLKQVLKQNLALKPQAEKQNQVFRSSPTLRELMQEYNGRKLVSNTIKADERSVSGEFQSSEVELINIPNIPGRVIRFT